MASKNIESFPGQVEVTSNLTVNTNTLHVDSETGRVGIGKTDPGYTMDVNGILNATALYVSGSEVQGSIWSSNISNAYYTTGAVGIGTDFPKKDLEVAETLRLSNLVTGFNTDLYVAGGGGGGGPGWNHEQKIFAPDGISSDYFGFDLAISSDGSYALVGAYGDDDNGSRSGSAYIFVRSGTSWTYQQKIKAPDGLANDIFGYGAVDISGDGSYALVGATQDDPPTNSGSAYIFVRSGTSWSYQSKLTAPDAGDSHFFAEDAAISGDGSYALIGAKRYGATSGAVYSFIRSGSTWTYQQKVIGPDTANYDEFGHGVSMSNDGSYAIVGARLDDDKGGNSGSAYIFVRSGSTWNYQAKLTAPDGARFDYFGWWTAISEDGSYAAASAPYHQVGGNTRAGAVYVFVRSGTSWSYQAQLVTPSPVAYGQMGHHIAISGDGSNIIVGDYKADNNSYAGAFHSFIRDGTSWTYGEKIQAPDSAPNDYFAWCVDMSTDGSYAISGSWLGNGITTATGCADIYLLSAGGGGGGSDVLVSTTPIQADGTILSFTGQHICFPEGPIEQGLVVSANKNKYVSLNGPLKNDCDAIKSSESLPVVSLSKVANDRSAFGVVDHVENGGTSRTQKFGATVVRSDKELGDNRVIVNSLGEGAMWVANTNGPLKSGDYITTSNIVGYGQKQEDSDTLYSYTVAKTTMDCDFEPEDVPIQVIKKDENGQNVLDEYGCIQWEEVPDQTEKEYNIRYLTIDGGVTDQANAVWKAAYVGCTYHCG